MSRRRHSKARNVATVPVILSAGSSSPPPYSQDNPPSISNSTLSTSSVTTSGFNVDFTKATDDKTDQANLSYKLYITTNFNTDLDTVNNVLNNGNLHASDTDVSTLAVSGKNEGDVIRFNVLVEDENGGQSVYTDNSQSILDETAPAPGDSGTLSTNTVKDTSFNVSYVRAIDNSDDREDLKYTLYTSTSDNVDTTSNAEANGTEQESSFDTSELSASGLSEGTTYYFNVIVEDASENKAAYTSSSQLTTGTPTDTTDPTPGDSGALDTSSITGSGFDVDYTKGSDDTSDSSDLVYKLYSSSTNNLDTDASTVESNGALEDSGTDVAQLSVSGKDEDETVYFNVVIEDEAGNQAIYTQNSETTADVTSPTVSNKSLSTSDVGSGSFKATYSKATDNISDQPDLTYQLYTSTSSNIDTVSNAEDNGTEQGSGTDVAELLATSLNSDTLYYFNVVVSDEQSNKTAYTMNSQRTSDLSSVNYSMDFALQEVTV